MSVKDLYAPLVHENILTCELKQKPVISDFNTRNKPVLYIESSYDKFNTLIKAFKGKKINYPLCIVLYDEGIADYSTINDKMKLFSILNTLPIDKIRLELSDSNFAVYNIILNRIGWVHESKTFVQLTLDRNPISASAKKEMHIEEMPGRIYIPDEKLIWFSNQTLNSSKNKIGAKNIEEAIELKRTVKKYCDEIDRTYDVRKLDDFSRTLIAYDWIATNISFPIRYTFFDKDGTQKLVPNAPSYISEPYGTYKYKEGVCAGQTRLMKVLLNNPCMKVDATTMYGYCPIARHAWLGINIDGLLYECCTTMQGPFKPLTSKCGYVLDDTELYPQIYKMAYLTEKDRKYVKDYTDSLKLKKKI